MSSLTRTVKDIARRLGFDLVGIAAAEDFLDAEQAMLARVEAGLMDGLPWFTADRARTACRPRARFPWARSIVALAVPYYVPEPPADAPPGAIRGRVSRYAWGDDYHLAIEDRLAQLAAGLRELGGDVITRGYVDTGAMPERAIAARAGLGWVGKNTNLLTPSRGSWVFLVELLTSLALEPDAPLRKSCGRCTLCLEACPTGALVAPYTLDNRRCIAYLTVELRGSIPRDLRPKVGRLIFGCDVCQDVCSVNARARPADTIFPSRPDPGAAPDLIAMLELDETRFRQRFRRSAVRRAGWQGLRRNAAVALGNAGDREAVPALCRALERAEPLVRAHAAWALGRLGGNEATSALRRALATETDAGVLEEIRLAGQQEANSVYFPPGGERAVGQYEVSPEDDPRRGEAASAQPAGPLRGEDLHQ